MRSLVQPQVLKSASIASAMSSLLCCPRLVLWPARHYPLWYLLALLFLGGTVLWAFVFGWYEKYTARSPLRFNLDRLTLTVATAAGIVVALFLYFAVDPPLRAAAPDEYPTDLQHWIASTLFSLAFAQLFLVFAPFAWLMRLSQGRPIAVPLTILFGTFVMQLKNQSNPIPISGLLFIVLLSLRLAGGALAVFLFVRGGIVAVCWFTLLVQARHLIRIL